MIAINLHKSFYQKLREWLSLQMKDLDGTLFMDMSPDKQQEILDNDFCIEEKILSSLAINCPPFIHLNKNYRADYDAYAPLPVLPQDFTIEITDPWADNLAYRNKLNIVLADPKPEPVVGVSSSENYL